VLWLGWYALNLLQPLLQRRLGTETARQIDSRLLRPAYLLLAALMLISSLDSIRDLAVAPPWAACWGCPSMRAGCSMPR